ncbi:hypothetical protein [Estrella lausannensis]|uniref:DUF4393 domain-containing protein n=1 Tax=Estrella lausannensis TaxID=483423 RepID=A0A0H5DR86_9BACT|nr:hypothetical protein [Estrella lausannensis]CRX39196.1 hypothetical protein ELAC_1871 [Estrella lausannensis]
MEINEIMDVITALTFTICSNNPLVIKVLGPTADYIGDGIKAFTEKRVQNLNRIFKRTSEKIDKRGILTGSVPPRILKNILDEGSYVDNELAAEYFSGALAASKSDRSRDDRALTILKLLSSMSNYEIRLHYILYSAFREAFLSSGKFNVTDINKSINCELFVPISQFIDSFALEPGEDINTILEHALPGLGTRDLINQAYAYGGKEFLAKRFKTAGDGGIIAAPSLLGAQLFLAAHGYLEISANKLCDSNLDLEIWDGIIPLKEVVATR